MMNAFCILIAVRDAASSCYRRVVWWLCFFGFVI